MYNYYTCNNIYRNKIKFDYPSNENVTKVTFINYFIVNFLIHLRVMAILSDFDGTLCPTSSITSYGEESHSLIPSELEDMLCSISENIPICIISSKDFYFL